MQENFEFFAECLEQYESKVKDEYNELVENLTAYMEAAEKIASYVKSGDMKAAREEIVNSNQIASNTDETFNKFMDEMDAESDKESKEIDDLVRIIIAVFIAICAVAFIIVAILCLAIIKQIIVPINKLSEASKKLAIGDVDVDCRKESEDDLGALMDEFNKMVQATREQARLAASIADGDLTVQVTPRSEKDILGKAIRKLVEDQNRTLSSVKESTMQVTIGSEQVASASQALAQGSTEQASALEQVTASIDEIAEKTKINASEASTANNLVNSVKEMAAEETA